MSGRFQLNIGAILLIALPLTLGTGIAITSTTPAKDAITSDNAQSMMKNGNTRFLSGNKKHPNQGAERRKATADNGQKPFVTILSCADSRVVPELIFDQGIGDIFVVRVAGNVADTDEIGTVEYGVEHLGTPLLVVMGHTKCGAVSAVVEGAKVEGSIPALVDNIAPAANKARALNPDKSAKDLIPFAIEENIWQSITDIFNGSEIVRDLVREKKLRVVGAVYDIESGRVKWLGRLNKESLLVGHGKKARNLLGGSE